ncbi:E3 ubiquitin-protein ligase listerin [Brevipalpus obovatus]|uniref:E3 ubiquitin-protein ligase listerin n=1 Tax=Brevipalpus obovatus TaxID=246614 RepID=UPI003D9E5CF5
MGKVKQRTKGNAKPSNSLRSALLLGTSAAVADGTINFIGFDAVRDDSLIPEKTSETEIDQDFKLTLKQMSKKDAVTKVKALQKFAELCESKEENCLTVVLPLWTRIFNKLAIDNDFRVREATLNAHGELVKKLGRNIAPSLKKMIAVWVLSLHDTYVVSANASRNSFSVAFSSTKQNEVLNFAYKEIINYCKNILIYQTIETIEDPSLFSFEEREAKYNRLVSCSLQSICLLISSINDPKIIEVDIEEMINDNRFWKIGKNPEINIKANWYKLKSVICEYLPPLAIRTGSKFTTTTLNFIGEKDPILSAAIWENVLWILVTIDDCWSYITIPKAFLPHLKKLLTEGGYGNASSIFPNILPMLSKFPFHSLDNLPDFFQGFFDSYEISLRRPNQSITEYHAIAKSYFECMQYVLNRDLDKTLSYSDCFSVVTRVQDIIKHITDNWSDVYGSFLSELTDFISNIKDGKLRESLLQIVHSLITNLLDASEANDRNLPLLANILRYLLRSHAIAKSAGVRFDEQQAAGVSEKSKVATDITIWSGLVIETWETVLSKCVSGRVTTPWFLSLKVLHEMFMSLSKHSLLDFPVQTSVEKLRSFLDSQANGEQKDLIIMDANNVLAISVLVNSSQNDDILDYLSSLPSVPHLLQFTKVLQAGLTKNQLLKEWVTSPKFDTLLKNLINSENFLSLRELDFIFNFLNFSLGIDEVHHHSINNLCEKLLQIFRREQIPDHLLFLISEFFLTLTEKYPCVTQLDLLDQIVSELFSKSFDPSLNSDIREKIHSCWTGGLELLEVKNFSDQSDFLDKLVDLVRSNLLDPKSTIERNNTTSEVLGSFTDVLYNVSRRLPSSLESICQILEKLFSPTDTWFERIISLDPHIHLSLFLEGQISPSYDLSFPSDEVKFDGQFLHSLVILSQTSISIRTAFPSVSKTVIQKLLPFALFAVEAIKCLPSDYHLEDKVQKLTFLETYISEGLQSLSKEDSHRLSASILEYCSSVENKAAHCPPLLLGFISLSRLAPVLESFKVDFKLNEFAYQSIIKVQFLCLFLDSNELISLSQDILNKFLCLENDALLDHSYYLSLINCLISSKLEIPFLDLLEPTLQNILMLKENSESLLLMESNLDRKSSKQLTFVIEIINLFIVTIEKFHQKIESKHKDFIILAATAWSMTIGSSELEFYRNSLKMIFAKRVMDLFSAISKRVEIDGEAFVSLREWTDFHLVKIAGSLIPIFIRMNELDFSGHQHTLVSSLGKCIASIPVIDVLSLSEALENIRIRTIETLTANAILYPLSPEFESVLCKMNQQLVSKYPSFYLSIHTLIQKLIPSTVSSSIVTVDEENDTLIAPSRPFFSLLQETDSIINTMLAEYPVGNSCCLIQPETDAFKYTIAYLLNWLQILNLFSHLTPENRSLLARYLTDSEYFYRLMDNLFRLMPLQPEQHPKDHSKFIKKSLDHNLFSSLDINLHVQAISCQVYYQVLRKVPACMRLWLGKLDKGMFEMVNSFTKTHMSDSICQEELRAVQNSDGSRFKEITVRARTSAREVMATYTLEHMSIELTIKLAGNHPLSPPSIDVGQRVGVGIAQWRTWLLQLTAFLTHQNGTVLDGLILWNRNMCKKFEGLEECVICFYILHGSTCQTPKLQCKNCKKKYHSVCLFKWFQKSSQSTCPLCRNVFDEKPSSHPHRQ